MEFPPELMGEIMSYLPHPYRRPLHLDAIYADHRFADFVIDRELYYEDEEIPDWDNSYMEYLKIIKRLRS
jgi:hypothetical protein